MDGMMISAREAALVHIDLTEEIENWRSAAYGRQVRAAQISALQKTQIQVNGAIDYIDQKGKEVDKTREDADDILKQAEKINTDSEENVKAAESWAHGHADYPDREQDNAKYWSEQAGDSAEDSSGSATLSKSWAVGGTDTRDGENTDNSKYWSGQSKSQADRAKEEADRASQYSQIVAPNFFLDIETGKLFQKGGTGVDFKVVDGKLYWKIAA